jgi:hypothetical protein
MLTKGIVENVVVLRNLKVDAVTLARKSDRHTCGLVGRSIVLRVLSR